MASNTEVRYTLTLNDLFTQKIKNATDATDKLHNKLTGVAYAFAGRVLSGAIITFGRDVMETTRKVEEIQNQLNFAAGSIRQGGEDWEYAKQKSNELGLDLLTTAKAFARMQGAAMGTSYAGEGVRKIFEGVSMASTVLHLSADETEGTMYALQQMMSKGKVSAEELNRQLGNRLPGALGIASRAMGMTSAEFMDLMKQGKILSEDFLPKFAEQLKTEFAGGVIAARESITVQTNLMNNALIEFKYNLGEATKGLQLGVIKGLTAFYQKLSEGSNFLKNHDSLARGLAVGLSILTAAVGLTTIGIIALTTGVWGLVAALWATGIPEIIIIFSALAGTIAYAYSEYSQFRGTLNASWPILKTTAKSLYAAIVVPFEAGYYAFKAFNSAIRGNMEMASLYGTAMSLTLKKPFLDVMGGIGEAEKAYNDSIFAKPEKAKHINNIEFFGGIAEPYDPKKESLFEYTKRIKGIKEKGIKGIKEEDYETKRTKSTAGIGKEYGHNIYININKLIETQNIKVENAARDFANNIAEEVSKALLMAVNDANRIATQ